jgi:glycosyltransferase involved in cell wall biosynthesis
MLLECIEPFINDYLIDEVVVVDDCSDIDIYDKIKISLNGIEKVKLYRNDTNFGVYYNKKRSVELASNEWVLVLDSDNIFGKDYVDKIWEQEWHKDLIFAPVRALPVFDYSNFERVIFIKENVANYVDERGFDCVINTMNYFVNRDEYLRVFEDGIEPIGSDTMQQNYNWLKAGNKIEVLSGLEYQHRVHPQSHYVNNAIESTPLCLEVLNKMRKLK